MMIGIKRNTLGVVQQIQLPYGSDAAVGPTVLTVRSGVDKVAFPVASGVIGVVGTTDPSYAPLDAEWWFGEDQIWRAVFHGRNLAAWVENGVANWQVERGGTSTAGTSDNLDRAARDAEANYQQV